MEGFLGSCFAFASFCFDSLSSLFLHKICFGELGIVIHSYNLQLRRQRPEDQEFKVISIT